MQSIFRPNGFLPPRVCTFKARQPLILLLLLAVPSFGCQGRQSAGPGHKRIKVRHTDLGNAAAPAKGLKIPGLQLRITEGQVKGGRLKPLSPARAVKLSPSSVKRLLGRLAPIKGRSSDEKNFAFRKRSLPPPLTGATIRGVFPPEAKRKRQGAGKVGPLKVLRVSPKGALEFAPKLSVTFSQPMVAISSHAGTLARGLPVRLSPMPSGKWRWIGTRTLLFEPKVRFPKATTYRAVIPAGTVSAIGGRLARARKWRFTTPPPRMKISQPQAGPHRRDTVVFISFDQKIDARAVLEKITFNGGGESYSLHMASAREIKKDKRVSKLVKKAPKGRWLAFKADKLLPAATTFTVVVGRGMPSSEGPLKTRKPQSFFFWTYAPLAVTNQNCTAKYRCRPSQSLYFRFNNPLVGESLTIDQIKIKPALKNRRLSVQSNWLYIHGDTKGRRTYRVTLPANLADRFGQTLGKAVTREFRFRSASPRLYSQGGNMITLDPSGEKKVPIYSVNQKKLEVRVYAANPKNWNDYRTRIYNSMRRKNPRLPSGKLLLHKIIKPKGPPDEMIETGIDLRKVLKDGRGQVILVVTQKPFPEKRWERQFVIKWVQATELALDAFVDNRRLHAWVTRLKDGRPVKGARISLMPDGATAISNSAGLAVLSLPEGPGDNKRFLTAGMGGDLAILPESLYYWGKRSNWKQWAHRDRIRWYVFDDRKMYKPGQTVRVKGWARLLNLGRNGGLRNLPQVSKLLEYTAYGPRGNKLFTGKAEISPLGGFDFKYKLPDNVNLGTGNVRLTIKGVTARGLSHYHYIKIQEFRRPEFEIKATVGSGPHMVGGSALVTARAAYFAGGGLPNARVRWRVTTHSAHFTPPGRGEYIFVGWRPWWWGHDYYGSGAKYQQFQGKTDSQGTHRIRLHFDALDPPKPKSVTASATVTDVNRQSWTATKTLLVHPANHYVGLKTKRYFVKKGVPLRVKAIVADLLGKLVKGSKITMKAMRLVSRFKKGAWKQLEVEPQVCEVTSARAPVECVFQTPRGGTYRLRARIKDGRGRSNQTEMTRWVSGGKTPPQRRVSMEKVQLIPDRKTYQPGGVAEILVQSPFYPAEGILTLRRSGIIKMTRFRLKSATRMVKVPIAEAHIPNLHVQVDLVGSAPRLTDKGEEDRRLPRRPALARGSLNLSVPPLMRKLKLQVKPGKSELEPGSSTVIKLDLKDARGRPVPGGEIALVVVDEAVLALSGYSLMDPLALFYPRRSAGTADYHQRTQVILADPLRLIKHAAAGKIDRNRMDRFTTVTKNGKSRLDAAQSIPLRGAFAFDGRAKFGDVTKLPSIDEAEKSGERDRGGTERLAQKGTPIRLRRDFRALALFAPSIITDGRGQARIKLKLPDSLTRYRIMAVAVKGARLYGKGESTVTARKPIMVRPSPPRFLNYGDRFELPIVLQNQTGKAMKVRIAVRAQNLRFTRGRGREVSIPANDRLEVRFPAATVKAGLARVQIALSAGKWSDAASFSLKVWTPATTEAFATYGTLDKGSELQPVMMPAGVFTQFGGLELTTSSTALQALTDAVLYLAAYPFECAEQRASRILAIAALRDVLTAFKAKGLPSPKKLLAAVDRDLHALKGQQNSDGGFSFWRQGYRSWPFVSIHVTHALVRARAKGFKVPAKMYQRALKHLKHIEKHIPPGYSLYTRQAIIAYSLYVREKSGDRDLKKARKLFANIIDRKKPPMEAIAWLYPVFSGRGEARGQIRRIRKLLNNRVDESAATAQFTTSYGDKGYLLCHSSRRLDGLLLEGLIKDQPKSYIIPKLVRGLLTHRKRGRWGNTQENAWVLLALDRYFNTYEKLTPDFVARAWLGEQFMGGHKFKGRTTERHNINIPMRYLALKGGRQNLLLSKKGPGRLYYRIGLRYAPKNLKLPPASHGFSVVRKYESVDGPGDVRRDRDGTWRVKAGARVRVVLTMVAHARRYHVALIDPLPAGLEPLNAALKGTEHIPDRTKGAGRGYHPGRISALSRWGLWRWRSNWFEHQNMRDERVEAFTSLLSSGVHSYSYVARATTPGSFVVPPSKAEEMYHPETFGRGAGDRLIVE